MINKTIEKPILGWPIHYLVSDKLKEDQTNWSPSYQCPIISPLSFFKAECRAKELGVLIGVFTQQLSVYSTANPESEEIYLLQGGIVQIGKGSIVKAIDDDIYRDRFRIIIKPKSDRLVDLEDLAKKLKLDYNFSQFNLYYQE